MALDPRSIIGEILSRRPDLRRTYAPQAQALGVQIAGLKPAVETRRRLETANAWRAGGPPMPGLSGMTPGLTPLDTGVQAPFSGETRRRLDAALPGPPGSADYGRERERALMRSPSAPFASQEPLGQQPPLSPEAWSPRYDPLSAALSGAPGSRDFGRERERALMRSPSAPFASQEPLGSRDDLATRGVYGGDPREDAAQSLASGDVLPTTVGPVPTDMGSFSGPPSPLSLRGPIPSSFGAGPGSEMARLAQFRPSFAPGTQERADATTARLPQGPGAGIMPGPVPPNMGSFPPRPPAASLAGDLGSMSPEVAALMGGESPIAPGLPSSGAPFSPYGPNASPARMPEPRLARLPQARPPQGVSISASSPEEAAPSLPPLSPQAAERARDIPNPAEALSALPNPDKRVTGAPGGGPPPPIDPAIAAAAQRAAWGAKPAATRGGFQPTEGFDQALTPRPPAPAPSPQPSAAYPGFDPAATPYARPTGLNLGIGTPANPPGTTEMNPVPNLTNPFNPNQQIVGARSPGFNLMGMQQRLAKPQTPLWDQRTPPAAGTVPAPGDVTQGADLPAPGPGASLTPQQIQRTMGAQALYSGGADRPFPGGPPAPPRVTPPPQQKQPFWNAPNIGTVVGAGAGLVLGGGGGAVAGAAGGRVMGKIVKALRARGQDVDAQGNILDKAGNIIGHIGGGLRTMFGQSGGGNSMASGGGGMGGWGGIGSWGGGSSYTGGSYGGNAGANINAGIGQRFGQR